MEDHNLLVILLKMREAVGWRWPSSYHQLHLSTTSHAVYGLKPGTMDTHLFSLDIARLDRHGRLAVNDSGINRATKEQFEEAIKNL